MQYGYIRVSTEVQTTENQKMAIEKYLVLRRMPKRITWVSETVSGTKKPEKRKLGGLVEAVQKGDTIIVTELSRLGRSLVMILSVLQTLLEKGVAVIAIKEGYELGDNLQSKVIAFAFGLSAEVERTLISERTKQGLERVRRMGKVIGRQKGQKPTRYKLTGHLAEIRSLRGEGKSKLSIARKFGVQWATLNEFCKRNDIL